MTMSVQMKKVYDLAEAYDKKLTACDFAGDSMVLVHHGDGTRYEFHFAFMLEYKDDNDSDGWLMVFTEHHDFHVFNIGDLDRYGQYQEDISDKKFAPDRQPRAPRKVFEELMTLESTDDGGQALVSCVNTPKPNFDPDNEQMFVRVQSCDETREHVQFKQFLGKKVQVTVEVTE